jgi:hypothetical protein
MSFVDQRGLHLFGTCCAKVEQELLLIIGIELLDDIVCIYGGMAPVKLLSIICEWTKVCEVVAVEGNLLIPSLWPGCSNNVIDGSWGSNHHETVIRLTQEEKAIRERYVQTRQYILKKESGRCDRLEN